MSQGYPNASHSAHASTFGAYEPVLFTLASTNPCALLGTCFHRIPRPHTYTYARARSILTYGVVMDYLQRTVTGSTVCRFQLVPD